MITSNFDIVIATILMFFSFMGLIRGFLKELSSVINWFGSLYLTSIIKPFINPLFEDKIKIPFLLDMVVNIVVFVGLIIIISIITNYLSIILRKLIPATINGGLGFLFGLLKGILLSLLIIAFMRIAYNKNLPDYLKNSTIYNKVLKDEFFVDILYNIFGDFSKESIIKNTNETIDNTLKNINENIENINETLDEKIENINDGVKAVDKNIDEKIEDLTDSLNNIDTEKLMDSKNLNRLIDIINE